MSFSVSTVGCDSVIQYNWCNKRQCDATECVMCLYCQCDIGRMQFHIKVLCFAIWTNYIFIYICIYVSMYLCIYVFIYLCIYIYAAMYLYIYVFIHLCIYISMYLYTYVSMYLYLCIYVSVYLCNMYLYIYMFMHLCIYVYLYLCIYVVSKWRLLTITMHSFIPGVE